MLKVLGVVAAIIATSCYIFPFEFKALPGINTKMVMAGFGLIMLFFQLAKKQNSILNKQVFWLSIIAAFVSLIGFTSITYNNTSDTSYVTYIVSVWVWFGGAYTAVALIRKIHGNASVILVGNYLIAVCVMQCALAVIIDRIPFVFNIVNTYIGDFGVGGSIQIFSNSSRLYGIGAAVDFAGARFAPILLIIAFFSVYLNRNNSHKYLLAYIIAFIIITIIGNMMSRTTTIGVLMAIAYWLYMTCRQQAGMTRLWKYLLWTLVIVIPIVVVLYNINKFVHQNILFGFEGFVNLIEKGYWETNSNNVLHDMYRFPNTVRTWIIGDGYFENPAMDPYYIGHMWKGFYMGTDVGYLRFIFYFGLIGLCAISLFMIRTGIVSVKKFPHYSILFILLILINFIVWFKVATDMLPILALFLMIGTEEDKVYMERLLVKDL